MSNNDWKARLGIVYSTNPDHQYQAEARPEEESVPPSRQNLKVWLDKKQRAGKQVTLIKGFQGPETELRELAALLKNKCGVGGSAKDGEIIIQGDHRDRILAILAQNGYQAKKAGG